MKKVILSLIGFFSLFIVSAQEHTYGLKELNPNLPNVRTVVSEKYAIKIIQEQSQKRNRWKQGRNVACEHFSANKLDVQQIGESVT